MYAKRFLWCPHIHEVTYRQTKDIVYSKEICLFLAHKKKKLSAKQGNDIPTIILTLLKWDKATWTKRIDYRISICAEKIVKTRPYSTLIQKSKGSSTFDEYKVENIAIEYRLQSIFPNPGLIPMKVFFFLVDSDCITRNEQSNSANSAIELIWSREM